MSLQVITSTDLKRAKNLTWELKMMIQQCDQDKTERDVRMAAFEAKKEALRNMKMKPLVVSHGWQELGKGFPFNSQAA